MSESHRDNIRQYVNDMIGVERDIASALRGQLDDERLKVHPELVKVLEKAAAGSENRLDKLKELSKDVGGEWGAAIKEGVTAITGSLAGIYGKFREHPISRMVRDDIVAFDVCAVSYAMLHTLGLSAGSAGCAQLAKEGLMACPPFVVALTDMLPAIVAGELAQDAPLTNPAAAQVAQAAIREAWQVPRQ